MKSLWLLLALAALGNAYAASSGPGVAPESGRRVEAGKATGLPPRVPDDAAWAGAPEVLVRLYPQLSVPPALEAGEPLVLRVRLLVGQGRLAVRLAWPDKTADRHTLKHTDRFADAAAVQFPARPGPTLPYIGMGEPDRPVAVWYWRAGAPAQRLGARGFGTLAPAAGTAPAAAEMRSGDGWAVVLRAALPAKSANPLPLAFAVWDGAEQGRAGRKRLSGWLLADVPGLATEPARYRALARENNVRGDAARGRALVAARGCGGCHWLPGEPPTHLGPALLYAGGIHSPAYLRRSILDPSAFVVPGKGYGVTGADGKPASLMPRMEWKADEAEDMVAYLAGLQ